MSESHFKNEEIIYKAVEDEDVYFVDTKGNKEISSLAIIVDGKDVKRAWVDSLMEEIKQAALNPEMELPEVVSTATKNMNEKWNTSQKPQASVLVARMNNITKMFESFSNGGCGMIVRYQDDVIESHIGNESTQNEPTARVAKISRDKRRNLSTYSNDNMWSLTAYAPNVKNVALFSSGMKQAFMNDEIIKEIITETDNKKAAKMLSVLSVMGSVLKSSQNDAVKKVSFKDRTALLFDFVDERE